MQLLLSHSTGSTVPKDRIQLTLNKVFAWGQAAESENVVELAKGCLEIGIPFFYTTQSEVCNMILSALEGTSNAGSNSSSLLASPAALQGLFVELSEPLKFHQLRLSEKMRLFSALVSQNPSSADNHSFLSLRGIVVHYMFNILVHVCEATAEPSFQEKERKQ